MIMGTRWSEFEAAAPEMAAAGRRLLYQSDDGVGFGYFATVRADGGPRVHPVCPHVAEGLLWVFVGAPAPKRQDLLRDPRYALHTMCPRDVDDEFYVTGRASPCVDDALIARVRAGLPFNSEDDDQPFVLDIERALWSKYEKRPTWPPVYTRWRAE
jgi:hypothetical protein